MDSWNSLIILTHLFRLFTYSFKSHSLPAADQEHTALYCRGGRLMEGSVGIAVHGSSVTFESSFRLSFGTERTRSSYMGFRLVRLLDESSTVNSAASD